MASQTEGWQLADIDSFHIDYARLISLRRASFRSDISTRFRPLFR